MRALVTGHLGFVGTHLCRELVKRGCKVIGIDLKNGADIVSCDLPDTDKVFHLAGQTDAQCEDAGKDAAINIMGSIRIFERYRDKAVFASSSMAMYPVTPYGISKGAAEDYARYFGCAVVRFCNLYGEGGHSVIDRFREADEITVYGTGEQVRTYEHVDVAVEALLKARPGTTTILKGDDHTVTDIVGMFPRKPVKYAPARPLDLMDARQIVACSKEMC